MRNSVQAGGPGVRWVLGGQGVCRWNLDVGRAVGVTGQERVHPRDTPTLTPALHGPVLKCCLTHISQQRSDCTPCGRVAQPFQHRLHPFAPHSPAPTPLCARKGRGRPGIPESVSPRCLFRPHVLLSVSVVRVRRCALQPEAGASLVKYMMLFIIAF